MAVKVSVAGEPTLMLVALKLAVTPLLANAPTLNVTAPVNPPAGVRDTVKLVDWPCGIKNVCVILLV